jgi:tetratricopeptide (TPR) repeat protein
MQGREEEKTQLTELFEKFTQNVNGGTTTVVMITGEKGMGKSMLVRHFLREIANVQAPVIVHCEHVDVGHSYAVFAGLLRHIFSLPLTAAPEALAPFALNLRKACPPELHSKLHLLNDLLDLPLFETPQVKTLRSVKSMRAMNDVSSPVEYLLISLLRASLLPGTVVVIEDYQWMDLASWSLTNQAGSDLDGVFILMTGRSWTDLSREEPPASASLRSSERSVVLQLGPLAKAELEAIASEELGVESVPSAISSVLEERSQGNPLVASEVLTALVENHFVTVENRVATFRGSRVEIDRAIPSTLGELFMARIDRRSVEEKLLLKYASVIGKTFLFDALFYLLGDDPAFLAHAQNQAAKASAEPRLTSPQTMRNLKHDKSTVRPWAVRRDQLYGECGSYMKSLLLELTFEKLLIQRSPEPLSFSFVNPLMHETVYSTMTYKLRAQIHDKVVSFYETRFPSQATGEYCTMLAHHSLLAENWSRTWFYHYLSGKKALAVYQNTNACEFFETALQSLAKSKVPTVKKGSLLWNAAKAQYSLGRYEKAEQLLEQAFEFYKIPLASSTAGKPIHRVGKLQLGTQIQSSLFKCEKPKQLLCLEQMVLVSYYRCSATRFQNSLQLLLKHADAFEDLSESVTAYHILSAVLDKTQRTEAVEARYISLEPTAQNLSLYLLFLMGRARWRRCSELVDELVESASKLGNRRLIEQALLLKCDLYHHEGHFHKSVELSATTASAASQRGDLHSSGLAMLIHARDLLYLGFTDEAKATIDSYITPLIGSQLAGDPAAVVLYHALNAAIATRHSQTARALASAELAFTQLLATEDTNYFLHYGAYLALQTFVLNLAQAFTKKLGKLLKRVFKHLKVPCPLLAPFLLSFFPSLQKLCLLACTPYS